MHQRTYKAMIKRQASTIERLQKENKQLRSMVLDRKKSWTDIATAVPRKEHRE